VEDKRSRAIISLSSPVDRSSDADHAVLTRRVTDRSLVIYFVMSALDWLPHTGCLEYPIIC
jgi:hypothetical protein